MNGNGRSERKIKAMNMKAINKETIRKTFQKIAENVIARNLILAFCGILVFVGVSAIALSIITRHGQHRPVPDFVGTPVGDVQKMARKARLELEIIDSIYAPAYGGGVVIEQVPGAGTEVKRGRRIFVTITSHQQKMVPVPYVTGFSLRQAKNMIEMAGLEIDQLKYVPSFATGNVLAELSGRDTVRRNSNLELEIGTGLTLIVGRSGDASAVVVPKVVGLPLSQAKSLIWERGLNVGEITKDEGINIVNLKDARVYLQSPSYGRAASLGSKVSVTLTLDEAKLTDGAKSADSEARRAIQARAAEAEAQRAAEDSAGGAAGQTSGE